MNRRLSPAERRQQIVRAAREVIVERGLVGTSLRDIAASARVSMGTVTYHFTGIDEILSAVVVAESERFYTAVVAAADADPDPRGGLAILIDALFHETSETAEHWRIWADYWAAVARRPEIAEAYADRIRHWQNCCVRVITRGVESGIFGPVGPEQVALKMAAYSDGLGTQLAQHVSGLNHRTAHRWMTEFVEELLAVDPQP